MTTAVLTTDFLITDQYLSFDSANSGLRPAAVLFIKQRRIGDAAVSLLGTYTSDEEYEERLHRFYDAVLEGTVDENFDTDIGFCAYFYLSKEEALYYLPGTQPVRLVKGQIKTFGTGGAFAETALSYGVSPENLLFTVSTLDNLTSNVGDITYAEDL